jgi:hypothetical protein
LAKKVKSISFNDAVPEEKEILKFVSRRNFSRYVKKLIKQDMAVKMAAKSSEKIISSETPAAVKKNRYENYR